MVVEASDLIGSGRFVGREGMLAREMSKHRICFVCFERVQDGEGVFDIGTKTITHDGECSAAVNTAMRALGSSQRNLAAVYRLVHVEKADGE